MDGNTIVWSNASVDQESPKEVGWRTSAPAAAAPSVGAMTSDQAELSTVATQIDDLVARITEVAMRNRGTERDDVSIRLFEVERSLISAARSLQSAQRAF